MVKIYALIEQGSNNAYVGKTCQTLNRRLSEHRAVAVRKGRTTKERWIREALAQGAAIEIHLLDFCEASHASQLERQWHQTLSSLGYLLKNEAVCGAGGEMPQKLDVSAFGSQLGDMTDTVLAARLGVCRKAISYHRNKLGIKASINYRHSRPPDNSAKQTIALSPDIVEQLGKLPDHVLAAQIGVSKYTIARNRKRRGIASYAETTGCDGKIKVGDPHRRWSK